MNKNFPSLLGHIASQKYSFPVQFHTNAMLLTPKLARKIVDNSEGVTVYLSIDGGSKITHEANRGAGTFHKALRGGWNLLAARGAAKWPRIGIYQLDLKERLEQYDSNLIALGRAVDFWQRVRPVLPTGDAQLLARETEKIGGSAIVTNWEDITYELPIPRGPCFWMGNSLCVAPNGDVSVCLMSHSLDGVIGNVLHEEPGAIVAKARELRRLIERNGRVSLAHCRSCRKVEGTIRPPKPPVDLKSTFAKT